MKNNWLKYPILIILSIAFSSGCSDNSKDALYGQENAIWAESKYLRGYRPSSGEKLRKEDIEEFTELLRENKIKYVYLFAGPYDKKGFLPDYAFAETAINSIREFKHRSPNLVMLPWVGGIQNKTVNLSDSVWVDNAINDTKRLIDVLQVPGVHIDFEYILKGDAFLDKSIESEKPSDLKSYGSNVNQFHVKLRQAIPKAFISSVVVATSTDTRPWKRKTSLEELKKLVPNVNQLSFLFYDTAIDSQRVFEKSCIEQLQDIKELRKYTTDTQFLMSIGTFVNRIELQKYRNLDIENIPNTLTIIKSSSQKVDSISKLVDGVSIFCEWETETREWEEFRKHW